MKKFGGRNEVDARERDGVQSGKDKFKEAATWEASRVHQMEVSERRGWKVAWSLGACLVLSWAVIVFMMPLKETVPYVVRVDSSTGIPDILTTLNTEKVEFDEVMDRYWLARYVRSRESYDWYTLQEDYETVGLLSASDVGKVYASAYEGDNALQTKRANRVRIEVEIISIVPTPNRTATVRFRTHMAPPDGGSPPEVANYVATIAYQYKPRTSMKASDRLVNPFGFVVTSYRVDKEMGGGL